MVTANEVAGMKLRTIIVTKKDIAEGQIRFIPDVLPEGFHAHAEKERVTTCKNCGAPVHHNVCEYCGTEY